MNMDELPGMLLAAGIATEDQAEALLALIRAETLRELREEFPNLGGTPVEPRHPVRHTA